MNSSLKKIHKQTFTGGQNTAIARQYLGSDQYRHMLNCDIMSSDGGKVGVVTSVKGTVMVQVDMPEGDNKTIGVAYNEHRKKLYYAVWNSNGLHTWYEYDSSSNTIQSVIQSKTDTGDVDIFKWKESDVILTANVINNDLLYWTLKGHAPRKINIRRALDRSSGDYGDIILEEYTRAQKRTSSFAPQAKYATDASVRSNNMFGNLFKFAQCYIYDDGERSVYSDFSTVPLPPNENSSGSIGVPTDNNCIDISLFTGSRIVVKIELIMQKTSLDGGATDWSVIAVLDKKNLNIPSDSQYVHRFYNEGIAIPADKEEVALQYSNMPRDPSVQSECGGVMVYADYSEGFPDVEINISHEVKYSELFVPDGTEDKLNDPVFNSEIIRTYTERKWPDSWRHTEAELLVGPDVKAGNVFRVEFSMYNKELNTNEFPSFEYVAKLTDNARTIASYFRSQFVTMGRMKVRSGYVGDVTFDSGGYARLKFTVVAPANAPTSIGVSTSVTPVNYSSLKNLGYSTPNEKLGSSFRYGLVYEDEDGVKSLTYGYDNQVYVKSINELGDVKKVETFLTINHRAPEWARYYSVVRTRNLKQDDFIQFLVQKISVHTTDQGDKYQDLMVGSLFTYQQMHPKNTLNYEFKAGDRVRLVRNFDKNSGWSVPSNVIDYEIMSYKSMEVELVNENVKVTKDSTEIHLDSPDINNVGSTIRIGGVDRTIIDLLSGANAGYIIDNVISLSEFTSENEYEFPYYEITNNRGLLRIKMNDSYPIIVEPGSKYALVEVYKPHQSSSDIISESYFDIGLKFEISVDENGRRYHRGNDQDQDANSPAIVLVQGIDNYVRNRELPTNTDIKNVQSIFTSIEDGSFSDFYVSDLSSAGRPSFLDDSRGVIHFDDRVVFSLNMIIGTDVNGLNIFRPLNRVDYNDGYGGISLLMYSDGKLFVFKKNKTGWVPVRGNIITDNQGEALFAASDKFLPDSVTYFVWDGGVGNNPESVIRFENGIFGVSPDNGTIFRIGGSGVVPISKTFGIDNEAREHISEASKSGVRMWGGYNKKKANYVLSIDPYEKVAYTDIISQSNFKVDIDDPEGDWTILSQPGNGQISLSGGVVTYNPNNDFVGRDYFSYRPEVGEDKNVCINVLGVDSILTWVPSGEYCVMEGAARTGYLGYNILEEFDNSTNEFTGNVKPNTVGDEGYVAPILNVEACPIGVEYIRIAEVDTSKGVQNIKISFTTVSPLNFYIKDGSSFGDSDLAVFEDYTSGLQDVIVGIGSQNATVFISMSDYDDLTGILIEGLTFKSAVFGELTSLKSIVLDQSSIPSSHSFSFNNLDVFNNTLLDKLHVINHQISALNLSNNTKITDLNVSRGSALTSLSIGSWSVIKKLDISECAFTSASYSKVFVDSIISTFDANMPYGTGYILKYGKDNNSGIIPSHTVTSNYESIVAKGGVVIGIRPNLEINVGLRLYAIRDRGSDTFFRFKAQSHIERIVAVPVKINFYIDFEDASTSTVQRIYDSITIQPGMIDSEKVLNGFHQFIRGFGYISNIEPDRYGDFAMVYNGNRIPVLMVLDQ